MMDHLALTTCRNLGLAQQGGGHQWATSKCQEKIQQGNAAHRGIPKLESWRALGCSGNTPGTIKQIQPVKGQSL